MNKNIIKKMSIMMAISFIFITMQTFACNINNCANDITKEGMEIQESKIIDTSINLRGFDDDVIYGYRTTLRQSYPNFAKEIRGFEIVRNGLRFRGSLYFQYSGGTPGDYFGVYEGDLYFAGRA